MFWKILASVGVAAFVFLCGSMPYDMALALGNDPFSLPNVAWYVVCFCILLGVLKVIWSMWGE
jgi:hypothetical protein